MLIHNFKYSFKVLFQNKMLIFWIFAFPIIMAVLFNLAFSNISNSEKLEIFDIALIQNEALENNIILKEAFKTLGDDSKENQLFHIKYTNFEEAEQLLNQKEITGYLIIENNRTKVVVKKNGMNETIFQNVVKEINQNQKMIQDIVTTKVEQEIKQGNQNINYENIYQEAINDIQKDNKTNVKDITHSKLDYMMIEYYTLIAMACLYGAILGMTVINNLLPNMSRKGMRINIAPVKKVSMILSSALASFVTQIIGLSILFIFTIFVLKIDYGNNLMLIMLLAFFGCLAGLSLGIAIGTLVKKNENTKIGILIASTMLGCFLSGMMGVTMKYVVDSNIPFLNKINPANMITDGFYSLYYYDTLDRYWFNIICLAILSIILIVISTIELRRQKYDSI